MPADTTSVGGTLDGQEQPADQPTDPWRILRRQQDRRRYLRILTPPRTGKEGLRRPNPAIGVPRSTHHLLGAPATMTRTATNFPHAEQVRQYLRHSADLTMRGGTAAAMVYPLAVCALAEHYVFRRIAGSSAGAAAAAATAAAELGRAAPDSAVGAALDRAGSPPVTPVPAAPPVPPGFAGLASMVGWLSGQDAAGQDAAGRAAAQNGGAGHNGAAQNGGAARNAGAARLDWPEQNRLARMFQPAGSTRAAYRALVAVLRLPGRDGPWDRVVPVLVTMIAALDRRARLVTALLGIGALIGWLGVTIAFARTPRLGVPLVALGSIALLVTFALVALGGSLAAYLIAARAFVRERAEPECFGLVPGVDLPDPIPDSSPDSRPAGTPGRSRAAAALSARLDRIAGVPAADGVPPLMSWLADRIDDLAGVPRPDDAADTTERYSLTFGELWLGRIGPRTPADVQLLRRAADDPGLRTVDLTLMATNVSQGRPCTLPFPTAERAAEDGASPFLFCRTCLTGVLPLRVVSQMILMSPAQAAEATCPRHPGQTLHEVPDPWDFPVAAAVRLSVATPGLLRAVPLCTIDRTVAGPLTDEYGAPLRPGAGHGPGQGARQGSGQGTSSGGLAARTHWFCAAGVTGGVGVQTFDTLLPRWPTFGLTLDELATAPGALRRGAEWLSLPEQDAERRPRDWRRVSGLESFAAALLRSARDWPDAMRADLPGVRGRVAVVRRDGDQPGNPLFLAQPTILQLAVRGYHAGLALRERFTGPDGDLAGQTAGQNQGQTQTDRYRWIRLRMALRHYRALSLEIGARLPLYSDLATTYRVPDALVSWFREPLAPGTTDPAWPDAAAAVTHLRALSAGGVLDWDTDDGAPPHPVTP